MKSIFRGIVEGKSFYVYPHPLTEYLYTNPKPKLDNNTYFIKWEEFYRCDVNEPPFESGSAIWIDELNDVFIIRNAIRSNKDYYVYDCEHIIRTEENLESKNIAEKELEKRLLEWQKKEDERNSKPEEIHKSFWEKFW